jgi:hypothetical protein
LDALKVHPFDVDAGLYTTLYFQRKMRDKYWHRTCMQSIAIAFPTSVFLITDG